MARLGEASGPVAVTILHAVPGRVRLRVVGPSGSGVALSRLARALRALECNHAVVLGRYTGTLLVLYRGTLADWCQQLERSGLLCFTSAEPHRERIPAVIRREVRLWDRSLRRISGEALDFRSLTVLTLLLLALAQALRGQWVGPASTLLTHALQAAGVSTLADWDRDQAEPH